LNITPTDANVLRSLQHVRSGKTKGKGGYQYNYLSLQVVPALSVWSRHFPTRVRHPHDLYHRIQELIARYDFIIVVDRMDESLVALALLAGLDLSQVLVTNSKVAGSYLLNRLGKGKGICHKQIKGTMSPAVQAYFQSDAWKAMNYADYVLYYTVHASLDRTIQRIGRDRFHAALNEYRALKAMVLEACGERLGYGCTSTGIPLPADECYKRDFGCGYRCVDAALARHANNRTFTNDAHVKNEG
jgi:hypothetical protein